MRPSRGMGAILSSKQPKKIRRKDGAEVDVYAAGGDTGSKGISQKTRSCRNMGK